MEEQQRMLDQPASALERALLQEGRSYRAPADLRAHTLAGLGVAASAGVVGSLLAWLSARSWLSKVVFALSAMTVLVGIGVSRTVLRRETAAVSPAPVAMPAPVAPPSPAPAMPAAPLRLSPPLDGPSAVPAPSLRAPTRSSALRAELAALDAVRTTLAKDDPSRALSFLTAYFRNFPQGRLRFEAEVLRIDALAKAGQTNAAGQHAREFLKRHPNTVFTARVRPYAEP